MRIILSLLLLMSIVACHAQSSKKKKKNASSQDQPQNSPTSVDPNYQPKEYGPKKSTKKKTSGPTYESHDEYESRMKKNVRAMRKNERLMEKPQYSDPMYFGHKHPPKKRPPNKMKFCKVCGIRH